MKKKHLLYFVFIVILIAGIKIFFPQKQTKTVKPESEKKGVDVYSDINGNLNFFPKEIKLHFSKSVNFAQGIIVPPNELENYLEIKPAIPAEGEWLNGKTFAIKFLKNPAPATEYTVKLKKLPAKDLLVVIKPYKFSFTTPEFKPLTVFSSTNGKGFLKLKIKFTLPLSKPDNGTRNKISLISPSGRNFRPLNISLSKNKTELSVVFPYPKEKGVYYLAIKRGIKSLSGFETLKDFSLPVKIGFKKKPLIVKNYRVRDLGDSFAVIFKLVSFNNSPVTLQTNNLEDFISVQPQMKINAFASNGLLTISGDFKPSRNYKITLYAGLKGLSGEELTDNYTASVTIPRRKPKLMFVYKGRYFGKKGEWKFPLTVKRIKKVNISVYRIPPQNVTLWYSVSGGSKWSFRDYAETIVKNREITVENPLHFLNLKQFIKNPQPGVYMIVAEGYSKETKRYYYDKATFVISDISVIAKWNEKKVSVWCLKSSTAEPVANAEIEIKDRANILAAKGKTDSNGYVELKPKRNKKAYSVFATTANDWTYLQLYDSMLPKGIFDIEGREANLPYLAYIAFERDLYRPGEKINFSVIVRENKTFNPVSIPLKIEIRKPSGDKFTVLNGKTDQNGFEVFNFKTSKNSVTGKYAIEVFAGEKNICTDFVFVETFVPERMSLKISFPETINLKQPFNLKVKADFLFGAPAKGEKFKAKLQIEETDFKCKGFEQYSFGPLPYYIKNFSLKKDISPITLNDNGEGKITVVPELPSLFQKPVRLTVFGEVSEGGEGRVTKKTVSKIVYTEKYYIGLVSSAKKITKSVPLKIKGVLIKPDCTYFQGKENLTYRIFKVYYNYDLYYYDTFSWRKNSSLIPLTEEKSIVAENGKFEINYTPQTSYDDIVIEVKNSKGQISQIFVNGWGWYPSDSPETPETLIIKLDKKTYSPGEKGKAFAKLPFKGKILWCLEADKVLDYKLTEGDKSSTFEFEIPEGYTSVYVSALLIRTGENYLVNRAFGIERADIKPQSLKLNIETFLPETVKPGSYLTVKCKAEREFEGTIAIVDTGILQIRNFETPDPFNGIFAPTLLNLDSAEGFGWLVKKYLASGGGTMGMVGLAEEEGEQPRFTKVVSFYSGKLKSDKNGNLVYKVKLPQFNGELRVMVCGVSGKLLGSSEKTVKVKSDIVTMPTVPRFLITRDKAEIPITLINSTDKKADALLKADFENNKEKTISKSVKLNEKEKKTLFIPVSPTETEPFKIAITTECFGEIQFEDEFSLPVLPPYLKTVKVKSFTGRERKTDILPYFKGILKQNYSGKVKVSAIPGLTKLWWAKLAINYPYGCIEQVSTKTLTLIKLSKFLSAIDPDMSAEKYKEAVREGIGQILSMQTVSGGFSYWPGGFQTDKWASAYATFVLMEAKNAGFPVPKSSLKAAITYLESLSDLPPFGAYVLAKAGVLTKRPSAIQTIEKLVTNQKMTKTSLLWYADALYQCGRQNEAFKAFSTAMQLKFPKKRNYNYDFYSPLKGKAVQLFVAQEINASKPLIDSMLEDLLTVLSKAETPYVFSTQELAWSLFAIGKYADNISSQKLICEIEIDGKTIKGRENKGVITFNISRLPETSAYLKTNQTPVFVDIVHTGYMKNFDNRSNGITVTEKLLNSKGKQTNKLKLGETGFLKITLKAENAYSNCAIEIPLAGGIEAENTRLYDSPSPDFKNTFEPDYVDIRDQKVILFGTITEKEKVYHLPIRAVFAGDFTLLPANAKAMYNPAVSGFAEKRKIKVTKQ